MTTTTDRLLTPSGTGADDEPRVITYAEAIHEAMADAMTADERVFVLGEDVGVYGGAFGVTGDLYHRFGAERVRDTPISECGIVGAAVGAALAGMRPIVEIQFSDFTCQAMDQIVNQAAKIHFMLGGAAEVPMVLRTPFGSGTGAAAQHSQSLEAWFAHVPGLKVVMPTTPADAKGLLLAAIDDPNPVIVLGQKLLYRTSGSVPLGTERTPIMVSHALGGGQAAERRRRRGRRPRRAHPHPARRAADPRLGVPHRPGAAGTGGTRSRWLHGRGGGPHRRVGRPTGSQAGARGASTSDAATASSSTGRPTVAAI